MRPKYFRLQQIMKGVLEGHKLPKALPLPEKAAYGEIEVTGCINLGQVMAAVGDPVTRKSWNLFQVLFPYSKLIKISHDRPYWGFWAHFCHCWSNGSYSMFLGEPLFFVKIDIPSDGLYLLIDLVVNLALLLARAKNSGVFSWILVADWLPPKGKNDVEVHII